TSALRLRGPRTRRTGSNSRSRFWDLFAWSLIDRIGVALLFVVYLAAGGGVLGFNGRKVCPTASAERSRAAAHAANGSGGRDEDVLGLALDDRQKRAKLGQPLLGRRERGAHALVGRRDGLAHRG